MKVSLEFECASEEDAAALFKIIGDAVKAKRESTSGRAPEELPPEKGTAETAPKKVCVDCKKEFEPKTATATRCYDCWKKTAPKRRW